MRAHSGDAGRDGHPEFVRTPLIAALPRPRFVVEADPAAGIIMKGVAERRSEVNFPWQAALLMGVAGTSRTGCMTGWAVR
jgi:hypothetical protein